VLTSVIQKLVDDVRHIRGEQSVSDLPVRKSNRLENYDYSSVGYYFITICIKDQPLEEDAHPDVPFAELGRIKGDANPDTSLVELTETGKMVQQHIESIPSVYGNVTLDKYVIMPNHIHMIVIVKDGTYGHTVSVEPVLPKVINAFKSLTSRQFGESMWQRSYHDHIIRNEADYQRIWQYIDENPLKWNKDRYYVE